MAIWRCEEARPWLDAYADGELEDAGRVEGLAGHVSSCAHCDAEVERIRVLKRQVRAAVVALPVPAALHGRVVVAPAPVGVGAWWRLAAAAAMVCVLSAGIWGLAIRPMREQIAGIVAVGCDSHIHCTVERKAPPAGPLVRPLPGHHDEIVESAGRAMPAGYHLMESHTCSHQGRVFTHLVFGGQEEEEERISVIVTRKGDREALPGWALLARMKANGIPVYEGSSGGVEAAVIETPRSWAYVVWGDGTPEAGLQVMARVADRIVAADRP